METHLNPTTDLQNVQNASSYQTTTNSATNTNTPNNNNNKLSLLQRQCSTQLNESSGYNSGFYASSDDISANENEHPSDNNSNIYRAMYDYQANHDDELTLTKGCEIRVVSKRSSDEGWWQGICDGKKGIFPSNYVEPAAVLRLSPQSQCRARLKNNGDKLENDYLSGEDQRQLPPHIPYLNLKFKDCIGAGGFGKVYRGYWSHSNDGNDDNEGELVAIKEARIEGDKDDLISSIKQSVLQEAKLFWQLRHPNIIQLKGICFQEPHFCLIMEYAKGGSLGRLLSVRKIGFPPFILIKWALQVSQGMFYLHEQALLPSKTPIIHRDLKSSNILLSEDAVSGEHRLTDIQLKLTDFGLARELQKTTNVMNAAGTYSHMPPEVIKSSTYSKFSDVWSFGVLLWELLTGEVPYKGIDPLAIAYGVAVNKLKLPIPSSCPHILSELIHGCWHSDPHQRLSFSQIIDRLTEIENSPFATTPNDAFWVMQQDWKCEIEEMFGEIRERESELRSREEELERVSMRQQAYECMLRQRERALEEREKDLIVRELSVALQQQMGIVQQPPPEPKKRRKVGGRLLTNFLRSSSSNASTHNAISLANNGGHTGSSSNLQTVNRSIDISSPSDFQHCFSIQPELLTNNMIANNSITTNGVKASTPTDDLVMGGEQLQSNNMSGILGLNSSNTSSSSHLLLSPVGNASPNLRLKIMLPNTNDKRSIGLIHQKTLSPYSSRERIHTTMKSNSIDNTDNNNNTNLASPKSLNPQQQQQQQQQSQPPLQQQYYQYLYQKNQQPLQQISACNSPKFSQKHDSRAKYQKSNSIWYHHHLDDPSVRSCSADVPHQQQIVLNESHVANQNHSSHGKALTRILYEIGSILSFVGLGKDYKQQQQKLNTQTTRRSQEKKYTPSTSSSNIHQLNPVPSETIELDSISTSTTPSKSQLLLSPVSTKQESQSLTRVHRTYPYRFKSLSSHHSSNTLDSTSNLAEEEARLMMSGSTNKLSPSAAKTAASVLAASSAAATAASSLSAQMSNSSNNLLSPRSHINLIGRSSNKNQFLVENQQKEQQRQLEQQQQNQAMLKQMQKKYSKSVDCTHYLDATNTGITDVAMTTNNLVLLSSTPGSSSRISCSSGSNLFTGVINSPSSSVNNSRSNVNLIKLQSSTECLQKEPTLLHKSSSPGSSMMSLNNTKIQRQHSHNSPLIPRRNDYEPVARVTIQRQQRVSEQSPTKSTERLHKNFSFSSTSGGTPENSQNLSSNTNSPSLFAKNQHHRNSTQSNQLLTQSSQQENQQQQQPFLNRPITLDLSKAFSSKNNSSNLKQNDSIGLSTTSTNEDDFLVLEDANNKQQQQQNLNPLKLGIVSSKDASLSLSSSSVPTSSSPMTSSPRLLPRHPSNASNNKILLTPGAKSNSQSSTTSS